MFTEQASGIRLGTLLQTIATITVVVIIAFIYSWKYALFVFGVLPFKIFGYLMQIKIAQGFSMKNKADLEEAGKVVRYLALYLREMIYQLRTSVNIINVEFSATVE